MPLPLPSGKSDPGIASATAIATLSQSAAFLCLTRAPMPILVCNHAGHVIWTNRYARRLFGVQEEQLQGRALPELFNDLPENLIDEACSLSDAGAMIIGADCANEGGLEFPVELQIQMLTEQGQTLLLVYVSDRTRQHATEKRLRRQLRETELLRDFMEQIENGSDLATTMSQACTSLGNFFGADRCGFVLLNETRDSCVVVAEYTTPNLVGSVGTTIPVIDNPMFDYVFEHRDTLVIRDARQDNRADPIADLVSQLGIVAMLIHPITLDKEVVGTIAVAFRQSYQFTTQDTEFVQNFASLCASALERTRMHNKLRHSESQLSSMLAQLLLPIGITRRDGSFVYANEAFSKLMGVASEELTTKLKSSDLYKDNAKRRVFIQRLQDVGFFSNLRAEFMRPDGSSFWGSISSFRFLYDGEEAIVSSIFDLTEEIESAEQLRVAKEQAETATNAKSRFLSSMTHELRTPMNGVLGLTTLLGETGLSEEQRELVEAIQSSGDMLLSVINNVLDYSKIEADKLELDTSAFSLRETMEKIVTLFRASAQVKGLSLSCTVNPLLPTYFEADVTRLEQVLANLLSNSIKFTEAGAIRVLIDGDQTSADTWRLRFQVSDTGSGIAREHLDRLFQAFSQADSSISRKFGGTGLGLSISKRIVEMMGGQIAVESQEGQGSSFKFDIRAKAHEVADTLVITQEQPVSRAHSKEKPRLLLAEDNVVNQKVALGMLKRIGYEPDLACNGLEVLNLMKHSRYDLILMDIHMPEMDGLEATRQIREQWPGEQQPIIIAVTANAMNEDREAYLAAGMDDFIAKPIQLQILRQSIEKAVSLLA